MPGAAEWAGITQGIANIPDAISQANIREQQQGEAVARRKQSELELSEFQANAPTRKEETDLKFQQLRSQTYAALQTTVKQQTYDAFSRFESDKNVRHLNTWLNQVKTNPVGANIYGDVIRYDALTRSTETDQMLRKMGYTDLEGVYNDPELSKDLVLVTGNSQRGLVNINDLYAGTGYTEVMDDKRLGDMERKARIQQMLRSGQSVKNVSMQEQIVQELIRSGRAKDSFDAYKMVQEISKGNSSSLSSTEERAVQQIMVDSKDTDKPLSYTEALSTYYNARRTGMSSGSNEATYVAQAQANGDPRPYEELVAEYKNLTKTSTQKEQVSIKDIRTGLDKLNWLDTPNSTMSSTELSKVYRDYIAPLEDFRGFKLSAEEKRDMRSIRDLTALGGQAGAELTDKETGLLDSNLNIVRKYISNEIGGKAGVAAYETFRNIFRNALYGASLTNNEIKSFEKAAGSLGQQLKPVLAQLNVQMQSLKRNLEGIRDTNDPDIAKYYTGMSIEEIDDRIVAIDERLNDPRLSVKTAEEPIKVKRKGVQATEDTVTPAGADFDFDSAMREAGF
jgi:hypothetical protein